MNKEPCDLPQRKPGCVKTIKQLVVVVFNITQTEINFAFVWDYFQWRMCWLYVRQEDGVHLLLVGCVFIIEFVYKKKNID